MTALMRPLDPRAGRPEGAKKRLSRRYIILVALILLCCMTLTAAATGTLESMVDSLFGQDAGTVDIIILLTLLTLLPSIVIMLTGFTRIIITFSFLRNALGMQSAPPNQVIVGLSLFLTFFVMSPVVAEIKETAYDPYNAGEIEMREFMDRAMVPTRLFMLEQFGADSSDIDFFIGLSGETFESYEAVPSRILIPAFMVHEIKLAFQIGFFIYIPFIVIDMVVASTLMAMGMMMLPPAMISLPFKVMLFVMVDGWQLTIGALMQTFT